MPGKEEMEPDLFEEVQAQMATGKTQRDACVFLSERGPPAFRQLTPEALRKRYQRAAKKQHTTPTTPTTPVVCGKDCLPRVQELVDGGMHLVTAFVEAAQENNVPESTVRTAWYRVTPRSEWRHGSNVPDDRVARKLLSYLLSLNALGAEVEGKDAEEGLQFITGRKAQGPEYKWGKRHLRKLIDLKLFRPTANNKMLTQGRADRVQILKSARKFAEELDNYYERTYPGGGPPPHTVVNVDETLLGVNGKGEVKRFRVSRTGTHRASKLGRKYKTIGSLVAFVAADGTCLLQIFVMRSNINSDGVVDIPPSMSVEHRHARTKNVLRGAPELRFMYSKSGRVDNRLYAAIMDKFLEVWNARYPDGLDCLLFSDQLGAHRQIDMIKKAMENHVLCWSLPRNTSHITQPLDDVVFGLFKNGLANKLEQFLKQDLHSQFGKQYVDVARITLQAAYAAAKTAFAKAPIIASFKNTHLFPFVKDEWMAHVEEEVNAAITVEGDPEAGEVAAAVVEWMSGESAAKTAREEAHTDVVPGIKAFFTDNHSCFELVELSKQHQMMVDREKEEKERKRENRKRKAAEVAAAKERTAAERVHKTCKYPGCTKRFQGGKTWTQCGVCKRPASSTQWRLCATHAGQADGQQLLRDHLGTHVPAEPLPQLRRRSARLRRG